MSIETIFDKILSGVISADVVYENEFVLAFKDANPQAPIHVLVIPKKRLSRVADIDNALSCEEAGAFLHGIAKTARALNLESSGYRVVINNGKDAKQTVEYLHAHILAGRTMEWPPG